MAELLDRAVERRADLLAEVGRDTDAWRLIHGSADGLDGLTADRLGDAILVERHRQAAPAEQLIEALVERFGLGTPLFLKERWSRDPLELAGRQVGGPTLSPDHVVVHEHGLAFALHLAAGEHVGLFLDARRARERVREVADGRRVLNLFCHTGGFGVAAAAGGARSTTNVDVKRSALETARRNYLLNDLPSDTRTFMRDDGIRFLLRTCRGAGRYDLVVLDPPARFRRAGGRTYDTREGYGRLVARSLNVLDPGGLLLAGSSALRDRGDALERIVVGAATDAGIEAVVVDRFGPGADFPPAPERPTGVFALVRAGRRGTGR